MSQRTRKKFPFVEIIFLICIAIGLFFFFRNADFHKFLSIRKNIHYDYLLLALLLIIVNILLIILRWYFLLLPIKKDISLKNVYKISISAIAVNAASPGKLGVPTKAVLLKRLEGIEVNQSVPSLFAELFLDNSMYPILIFVSALIGGYLGLFGDFFHLIATGNHFKSILFFLSIVFVLGFGVIVLRRKLADVQFFQKLLKASRLTLSQKGTLVIALGLTLVNLFLSFLGDWCIFRGVGLNISYLFVVFSSSLATFIGFISPLAGGIGIREMTNAYLFKMYFNVGEIAFVATILRRIMTYITLGFLFITANVLFGKILRIDVPKSQKLHQLAND